MSKPVPQLAEEFDLSLYFGQLLAKYETNDGLRKRIQNDIQLTKTELIEGLMAFDMNFKHLDTNYHKLMSFSDERKALETQLNSFIESEFMSKIEKLNHIYHQMNERIIRSKQLKDFIHKLKQLNSEIDLIDQSFSLNSYEMSVQYMTSASELHKELMETMDSNNDLKEFSSDLKTYLNAMKTELTLKREEMIYNSKQLFNTNVKAFRDEFNNENIFEYNLIESLNTNDYKNYIKAFIEIQENNRILKELINNLNLFFIKPILSEEVNQIVFNDNKIIAKTAAKPTCPPLSLLKLFFDYLNQLITNNNEITIGRQLSLLLGNLWTEDIFDQILRYYLNRLMPKTESEVKAYLTLVDSAEDIRRFMIEIGFIEDNTNSPFIEFALNINSHFCRRLCTDFLIESKAIICRDLHQTVEVGTESEGNSKPFPLCRVSQSMLEIKEIIERIVKLCDQCSAQCSEALVETIGNVCELYVDISPLYHKRMINGFPQQNAIFHNNCMFFANFMEMFALKHKSLQNITEMVPIIRQLGSEVFLKQMRSQEKIILELIQSQQFSHCLNDLANEDSKTKNGDQLAQEFRQVLRQCLVHLNFLKNALIDVLPERVYYKAVGTVVNTLVNELINKISIQNDISSAGAVRLSQEIEFLLKEIQDFFNTESPIRFVPKWTKISELNFILKANLLDIVNRWADGKGILAAEFTAHEVKQLIRSLFQNTERRAQALNKINIH